MSIFDTDREKVAEERFSEAKKALGELQHLLVKMDKDFTGRVPGMGFSIAWCTMAQEKINKISCEISRGNGALLVRSTP